MKANILIVKKMVMEYNMIIKVKFYMKVNFVMEREMGGEEPKNIKGQFRDNEHDGWGRYMTP
jgi:hypothetical protein